MATDEEMVVLAVWLPGQVSPAHDHGGSTCTSSELRGIATEHRFERAAIDRTCIVEEARLLHGSIGPCDGDGIHALGNDAARADPLVTLHVYLRNQVTDEYAIEAESAHVRPSRRDFALQATNPPN